MANRGKSRHIKGLNAPRYLAIHRKEQRYVAKTNPGRHTLDKSITLLLFASKAELTENAKDARKVIKAGSIHVNGKPVKDPKYPIGLNDTIEIPQEKKYYKIGITELAKVAINPISKPGHEAMLYKVVGKYKAKGEKIMIRLHDGSAVHGTKDVKVNDSVILDSKRKITKVLKLDVGAECEIVDGVHVGTTGKIQKLVPGTMHKTESATIEQKDGNKFETLVKNVMVTS